MSSSFSCIDFDIVLSTIFAADFSAAYNSESALFEVSFNLFKWNFISSPYVQGLLFAWWLAIFGIDEQGNNKFGTSNIIVIKLVNSSLGVFFICKSDISVSFALNFAFLILGLFNRTSADFFAAFTEKILELLLSHIMRDMVNMDSSFFALVDAGFVFFPCNDELFVVNFHVVQQFHNFAGIFFTF